ncbi:MAG: hypothetical protein ABSG68_03520 [Thermoguttaceae bacterium]
MAVEIVDQLRAAIDAKHQRAIEALKTVAEYLEEQSLPTGNSQHKTSKVKKSPRAGTGNIRNAALTVFREGYLSIREASEKTGLTVLQVRGVVSAPALRSGFTKKEADGITRYHFQDRPGN